MLPLRRASLARVGVGIGPCLAGPSDVHGKEGALHPIRRRALPAEFRSD